MTRSSRPTKGELDRCRRCGLWAKATQAVAGEGPAHARIMLVGEQPGDAEDVSGRPFVGPAGQLLRRLLEEAGIDVRTTYVTNAVKHFSWELRGKRRIHKTPAQREIAACQQWLERELAAVAPSIVVALGATALRALTGARGVGAWRGKAHDHVSGARLWVTYHPSAALRGPDAAGREAIAKAILADFKRVAEALAQHGD